MKNFLCRFGFLYKDDTIGDLDIALATLGYNGIAEKLENLAEFYTN